MTLVSTAAKSASSTGRVVLFDSTLGVAAASIDTGAGGIAAGYSVLSIYIVGRTTEAVVSSSVAVKLNNDGGANYDQSNVQWTAAAVSGGASVAGAAWLMAFPGASMDANSAGTIALSLPSYDQTTFNKEAVNLEGLGSGTSGQNAIVARSFRWRNTAAVTRLAVTAGSGNLVAGSRLLILGG